MRNNDTFITQAMLSSYLAVETKDYLELLIPFVEKCLPVRSGEKININIVKQELNAKYDLDIPYNVIEKLLSRLCKKKRGAYVKRIQGEYIINMVYDTTEFDERSDKIKNSIDKVIKKMQKYMNTQKFLSGATYEKMQEYLSDFLDSYNYVVYENAECLNSVTLDKKAESNYYVAQFILAEYENDTLEFNCILDIIRGALAAKSIYYFMNSNNDICENRIHGTTFILDTRVLIDALGLNLQQEHVAMSELLQLIIENGGKLITFDYYVEELRGILYKYEKSIETRLALSLNFFVENKYSSSDVAAYANLIEERLEELCIHVIEKPCYDENVKNQNWTIDYNELRDELNRKIDYRTRNEDFYSEALIHDADTIEAIALERGGSRKCSVFNCKVIFVTRNRDICNVIYNLYRSERFSKGEINFAITDIDLTAIIWLSTFGSKSNLPKLKLLENAYSACVPSRPLMNEFLKRIKSLEDSEKISKETAILLRSQYATIDDIAQISHNCVENVSDNLIYEVERRLYNKAEKDVKIQYKREFEDLERQKNEVENDRNEVENRRGILIVEQRRTSKLKQDAEIVMKKLDDKRNLLAEEREVNNQTVDKIRKIQNAIIDRAKKRASIYK